MTKKRKQYDRLTLRFPFGTVRQLKIKALERNLPVYKYILELSKIEDEFTAQKVV